MPGRASIWHVFDQGAGRAIRGWPDPALVAKSNTSAGHANTKGRELEQNLNPFGGSFVFVSSFLVKGPSAIWEGHRRCAFGTPGKGGSAFSRPAPLGVCLWQTPGGPNKSQEGGWLGHPPPWGFSYEGPFSVMFLGLAGRPMKGTGIRNITERGVLLRLRNTQEGQKAGATCIPKFRRGICLVNILKFGLKRSNRGCGTCVPIAEHGSGAFHSPRKPPRQIDAG